MIKRLSRFVLPALVLPLAVGACDILDVENPNNLVQEDLEKVAAANAAVNGAEASVLRAYSRMIGPISTASDEITWIGSRDAWLTLNQGNLTDPANEFVDEHFPFVGEARWMADEATKLVDGHFAELGTNTLQEDLGRANLNSGIVYTFVGEFFDDFVFSDRMEPGVPFGPSGMSAIFDQAITKLGAAISNATAAGDTETANRALSVRMRAYHARAVWQLLNPAGSTPANPLVNDAGANADAEALLAAVSEDWRYEFVYIAGQLTNNFGSWVNEREEMQIGELYGRQQAEPLDPSTIEAFILEDPIDNVVDPRLVFFAEYFTEQTDFGPLIFTSARMAHLILAEAALAAGDSPGFAEHINAVRTLNGMTPFSGQIPELDMLQHERRVNLYLQGTRLNDQYRFGVMSNNWLPNSDAATTPGTLLPITRTEVLSNPNVN